MTAAVDRPCLATTPFLPVDLAIDDRKGSEQYKPIAPAVSRTSSRHSALSRLRERRAQRRNDEADMEDLALSPKGSKSSDSCQVVLPTSLQGNDLEQSPSDVFCEQLLPRPPTEPQNLLSARLFVPGSQNGSASCEVTGDSLRPSRPPPNTQGRSVVAALRQVRIDEARRRQRVAEVQAIGERRNVLEEEKAQDPKSQVLNPDESGRPPSPATIHQEVEQRSPARLALQHRAELRRAARTPEPAVLIATDTPELEAGMQSVIDENLDKHSFEFGEEMMKRPMPICRSYSSEHDLQDGTLSMASTASTFRPARSASSTPYGTDDGLDDMLSPNPRDCLDPSPIPGVLSKSYGSHTPEQRDALASSPAFGSVMKSNCSNVGQIPAPMCLADSIEEFHQSTSPDTHIEATESGKGNQTCGCVDFSEQEEAALAILRKRQVARHVARGQVMVENSPSVSKCTSPEPCSPVEQAITKAEHDETLDDDDFSDSPSSRPVTRRGSRGDIGGDHVVGSFVDSFDRPQDCEVGSIGDFAQDFFGCELAQAWSKHRPGGDSQRAKVGLPSRELDYSMPPCDAAIALGVSDEGRFENRSWSSSDSWIDYFDQPGELELCDQRLPSRDLYVILEEVEMEGRSALSDLSSHFCHPDMWRCRKVCAYERSCKSETDVPGASACDLLAQGETSLPQIACERQPGDSCIFTAPKAGHSDLADTLSADDASRDLANNAKERLLLEKYGITIDEDAEWLAAVNIQTAYRIYCKGKPGHCSNRQDVVGPTKHMPSSEEVRRAAVISTAKSLVALRAQVQRETEWAAALRIQTCWRGHSVRRRFIAERILTPRSGKQIEGTITSSRHSKRDGLLKDREIAECERAEWKSTPVSRGGGDERRHLAHRRVKKQSDVVKAIAPPNRPPSRPSSVGRRPMVSELMQKEAESREKLPKLLVPGHASRAAPHDPISQGKIPCSPRTPEGVTKIKSLQMPLLAVAACADSPGQAWSQCTLTPGTCSASPRRQWG